MRAKNGILQVFAVMVAVNLGGMSIACATERETGMKELSSKNERLSEVPPELSGEKGHTGEPLPWELIAETHWLPGIRLYLAQDRYPVFAIVDQEKHRRIPRVDEAIFNGFLDRFHIRIQSPAEAAELARFFITLREAPYLPRQLEARPTAEPNGYTVELSYERTTPWSPPGEMVPIAGSMTNHQTVIVRFGIDECLKVVGEHSQPVRQFP